MFKLYEEYDFRYYLLTLRESWQQQQLELYERRAVHLHRPQESRLV